MVFEYILKNNGIDPAADLEIDQSIDFGSTAAAFTGDASAAFTVEFEPSATALEKEGAGYVVASPWRRFRIRPLHLLQRQNQLSQ